MGEACLLEMMWLQIKSARRHDEDEKVKAESDADQWPSSVQASVYVLATNQINQISHFDSCLRRQSLKQDTNNNNTLAQDTLLPCLWFTLETSCPCWSSCMILSVLKNSSNSNSDHQDKRLASENDWFYF